MFSNYSSFQIINDLILLCLSICLFSSIVNYLIDSYFSYILKALLFILIKMSVLNPIKGRKVIRRIMGDEDYVMYTQTNRRRKFTKKYVAAGPWTCKENEIYLKFLQTNRDLFQSQFSRRSFKVFQKMSKLLRRRDPEQCRSHHQKLILRCNGDFPKIIELLKVKIIRSKQTGILTQNNQQNGKQKKQSKQKQVAQESTNFGVVTYVQNQHKILSRKDGSITIFLNLDIIQDW